jgi:hypothetical protein
MTKAIKHIIEIQIDKIEKIHVLDRKLPEGNGPRGLNKISAIVSLRRNKNVTTSGASGPLQPSCKMQNSNGSYLYQAKWKSTDGKDASKIHLQTNLRPQKQQKKGHPFFDQEEQMFEPKRYDVVFGLKRGNEFIVLGTTLIYIDKEMQQEEMTLPLIPINSMKKAAKCHDALSTAFVDDESRHFSLDSNAILHCSITVINQDTWYHLNMERTSQRALKNDVPTQATNPEAHGDIEVDRDYDRIEYYSEDDHEHYNNTYEDSRFDVCVGFADSKHESERSDEEKIQPEDKGGSGSNQMTISKNKSIHLHYNRENENDDNYTTHFNSFVDKKPMESEEFDNGEGNAVLQRSYFDQLTQSISSESFPEQKRPDMNFMNFAQKGFDKISKSVRVISDRGIHIFESSSDPDVDNIDDLHEENVFESIAIAFKRLKTVAIE